MQIQLSSIKSAEQILKIFKDCKKSMELENIHQWTDSYPNFSLITKDIHNKELYELDSGGEIAGVICLNNCQASVYENIDWLDKNGNPLIIHRLAIHPQFQNKGLAKKLMTFAEEYAFDTGFSSIRLDAFSGNEKALRLYEQRNYKKRGQVNFLERDLPFFCYEKNIKMYPSQQVHPIISDKNTTIKI